eukprot:PhF_6_TR41642/c1_g1_i4/m.63118
MNATPSLLVDFRGNAIPPQVVDSKQIQLEKFPDGSTVLRLKCGGADLCTPVLAVNTKETFQSLAEVPAVVVDSSSPGRRGDKPTQQQGNEDDAQEDEDSSSPVEAVEEGNDEGEEGKEAPPQPRPKRNMRRQEPKEGEEGQEGG